MPIATDITLDEASHRYFDSRGKEYTSVSRILGRYKAPFNREEIAQKVAAKTGQSLEDVYAEWDSAAPYGTNVHAQLEGILRGEKGDTGLITPYLSTVQSWLATGAKFHPEVILYLGELAGTADVLVEKPNGHWSILDWKTNKAIYKTSFRGVKLAPPLDHLDDCNFVQYSLQLNIYAKMLGKPVDKMSLIHLPRNRDVLEIIPCLRLEKEVDLILEEFNA